MSNYEKALQLRQTCKEKAAAILPQLEELSKSMAEFYEIVRYKDLGCTDKQYSALYEDFVYEYEKGSIEFAMRKMTEFCKQINKP